jgi:hypothetical protein
MRPRVPTTIVNERDLPVWESFRLERDRPLHIAMDHLYELKYKSHYVKAIRFLTARRTPDRVTKEYGFRDMIGFLHVEKYQAKEGGKGLQYDPVKKGLLGVWEPKSLFLNGISPSDFDITETTQEDRRNMDMGFRSVNLYGLIQYQVAGVLYRVNPADIAEYMALRAD